MTPDDPPDSTRYYSGSKYYVFINHWRRVTYLLTYSFLWHHLSLT